MVGLSVNSKTEFKVNCIKCITRIQYICAYIIFKLPYSNFYLNNRLDQRGFYKYHNRLMGIPNNK